LSFFTFAFPAGCSAKSKGSGRIGYLLTAPGMRSFAPIFCRVSTVARFSGRCRLFQIVVVATPPILAVSTVWDTRCFPHAADPVSLFRWALDRWQLFAS
jgi:hypothetical protein